jgi:hypothetical protein
MADSRSIVTIPRNQPLIGIPFQENGQEVIRYFSEEALADCAISDTSSEALTLTGAWGDLSWDKMEKELERIRHASAPTPPIDL